MGEGFVAAFKSTDERADIEVSNSMMRLERVWLLVSILLLFQGERGLTALNFLPHPGSGQA